MVSEEYAGLAEITIDQNKVPYCEKWNYGRFTYRVLTTDAKQAGYDRLQYLLYFLESMNELSPEWFWLQGADTMIMDFTVPIDHFVDNNYHCIIGRDCYSLNGDSVLIRNSRKGRHLVYRMLSERDWYVDMKNAPYADCSAYVDLSNDPKWKGVIKEIPQKSFNSADYTLYGMPELLGHPGQYTPGDFLIHWGGLPLEVRIREAKRRLLEVKR